MNSSLPSASPFAAFVAPARAYPQLWRLIVGLLLILVVMALVIGVALLAIWVLARPGGGGGWVTDLIAGQTTPSTFFLLFSMGGLALGAATAARLLHKRPAVSLIGPARRAARDFLVAAGVVALLYGAAMVIWSIKFDPVPNLPVDQWLMLLPLGLLALLIQTGAEEIAFRGYVFQQLAVRFRPVWIAMIGSSVIFGMLHYHAELPPLQRWLIVAWATGFGLAAADLTRVTGNIGAAWGFHMVNNCAAVLILATEGIAPGLALYHTPYNMAETPILSVIAVDGLVTLVAWIAVRRAVAR